MCRTAFLAAITLSTCGCAGFRFPTPDTQDVAKQRAERKEEFVREFETNRDRAQFHAAQQRWQEGDAKAAHQLLEPLLVRRSDHAEAHLLMAEVIFESEPQAAVEHAQQAVRTKPKDPQAHHTLAVLLEASGRSEEAKLHFTEAVRLDPDANFALGAGGPQGKPSAQRGPKKELVNPARPPGRRIDSRVTHIGAVAPAAFSEPESPGDPSDPFEAAASALDNGRIDEAREYLTAAAAGAATPDSWIEAAVLALRHKQPALAAEMLTPAAKRFPGSAALHRTLGLAQYRSGDYELAQVALEQALSLDNSHALSYFLMGSTLEKLGRSEGAQRFYREAASRDARFASHR